MSAWPNVTGCANAGGRSVLAARFGDIMLTTIRILSARQTTSTNFSISSRHVLLTNGGLCSRRSNSGCRRDVFPGGKHPIDGKFFHKYPDQEYRHRPNRATLPFVLIEQLPRRWWQMHSYGELCYSPFTLGVQNSCLCPPTPTPTSPLPESPRQYVQYAAV
ncbi:hypothetical protein BDU57DRAFT_509246 [Ampelomyces quisqualis]|uniref:Uncharacterized protein n=1 Tax=Ampelomyces quisqualis TaxID=50730 RepID=A0A6A5R110_AMPQU|nr:hypothetical protein BDU57DRAFT_509246 [Ampelomyces quisqualis]